MKATVFGLPRRLRVSLKSADVLFRRSANQTRGISMKIYGVPLSPFTRKVLLALQLKGLDYELISTLPGTRTPEFLAISPLAKVPVMVDGDLTLCDSSVICQYLEERYPEVSLLPDSIEDRARARWLEEYADSRLAAAGIGLFWQLAVRPMLKKEAPDMAIVERAANELLPEAAGYLESRMPEQGFLFGRFGLADISIFTHLLNAGYVGYPVDAERWPRLAGWFGRCCELPQLKQLIDSETAFLKASRSA